MTRQLTFDDQPAPLARRHDPATSHQAAAEVQPQLGRAQWLLVDGFRRLGRASTAAEAAAKAHEIDPTKSTETYRKRTAECVRLKYLRVAGTRKCSITGKNATTYLIP
jgi:hypothetical protein